MSELSQLKAQVNAISQTLNSILANKKTTADFPLQSSIDLGGKIRIYGSESEHITPQQIIDKVQHPLISKFGKLHFIEDCYAEKLNGNSSLVLIEQGDACYFKAVTHNGNTIYTFGHIYDIGDKSLFSSYTKPLIPIIL